MVSFRPLKLHVESSLGVLYEEREAKAIANQLFQHVLKLDAVKMRLVDELTETQAKQAERILARLLAGEPLQYITGIAHFHGLDFAVSPDVLIPRPETEGLVDLGIEVLQAITEKNPEQEFSVLDACTGSGCVAIAIAKALPKVRTYAFDVSLNALAIAQANNLHHNAGVSLYQLDLMGHNDEIRIPSKFDLILSNPPYVPEADRESLAPHVRDYEPALALFVPDYNPIWAFGALAGMGYALLKPRGWLIAEGYSDFLPEVKVVWEWEGYQNVEILEDAFGRPRFVRGQWMKA